MDLSIISLTTFLVALLASYYGANALLGSLNEKHAILIPFQEKLLKSKQKKLIKRYYFLAAFTIYVILSGLLNLNDLEHGILLGVWSSFIILVYEPFKLGTR